ncbi:MAG TPA: hypothetical protein DCY61_01840 [Dehalococcoidia bacterium]|nr:hypothetical protein [Dehalococcoidia bacterium]
MGSVAIKELRNRLSYYLEQVRKGKHVTITRRGRTVAVIVPAGKEELTEKLRKPLSQIILEDRR